MSHDENQDHGFDPELRKHLLQDLEVSERSHRVQRRVQYALIAFATMLLVVICLAIWASTIRARAVLAVYGDGVGGDALPSAVRVVMRDPKGGGVLAPKQAALELRIPGQPARALDNFTTSPETVDAALFASAEEVAAGARLAIAVESDGLRDEIEVPLQAAGVRAIGVDIIDAVEALQKPKEASGAIDKPPSFPRFALQDGEVEVRLYPESGTLVPVLGNNVALLALRGGALYPGLRLKVDPPGWDLRTDAKGMAPLRLTPGRELGALKIRRVIEAAPVREAPTSLPASEGTQASSQPAASRPAGAEGGEPAGQGSADAASLAAAAPRVETGAARVVLDTPPAQILVRARQVLVAPGVDFVVDVGSVRLRTWLSLEVWYGDRLVALSYAPIEGGRAELTLPSPEKERVLVGVRLARSPVNAGVVTDTAFVYVDKAGPTEAWRHLVEDLGEALRADPGLAALSALKPTGDAEAEALMRVLLSRARLTVEAPPALVDSEARNHARAEAKRLRWQGWLFAVYWLLGIGALVLAVTAVLLHNRRVFQGLAAFEAEAPEEGEQTAKAMRRRGVVELIGVCASILFGLFALYYLLSRLWWG